MMEIDLIEMARRAMENPYSHSADPCHLFAATIVGCMRGRDMNEDADALCVLLGLDCLKVEK